MKSLFNEYEAMNKDANELADTTNELVLQSIKKYCTEKGYSLREVESVIINSVVVTFSMARLIKATDMRKEKE